MDLIGIIWPINAYTGVSRIKCSEVVLPQCQDNGSFAEFQCSEHKGAMRSFGAGQQNRCAVGVKHERTISIFIVVGGRLSCSSHPSASTLSRQMKPTSTTTILYSKLFLTD